MRFLRFSAFYSPLLVTMRGGHLEREGLEASFDVVTAERTIEDGFRRGDIDVAQSAVAVHFRASAAGEVLPYRHFAAVNRHDGFFLARRGPRRGFEWDELRGATILADHFFQPLALLTAALDAHGIGSGDVELVDAGTPEEIEAAFRSGRGDVVHLQGPGPHQLEVEGLASVVAAVGAETPAIAFSSVAATPEWLATDEAAAFTRAYRCGREHARTAPAEEVASIIGSFLPGVDRAAVVAAVGAYQAMGTWEGDVAIDHDLYDSTVELFGRFDERSGRPPYDDVIAAPPAT